MKAVTPEELDRDRQAIDHQRNNILEKLKNEKTFIEIEGPIGK